MVGCVLKGWEAECGREQHARLSYDEWYKLHKCTNAHTRTSLTVAWVPWRRSGVGSIFASSGPFIYWGLNVMNMVLSTTLHIYLTHSSLVSSICDYFLRGLLWCRYHIQHSTSVLIDTTKGTQRDSSHRWIRGSYYYVQCGRDDPIFFTKPSKLLIGMKRVMITTTRDWFWKGQFSVREWRAVAWPVLIWRFGAICKSTNKVFCPDEFWKKMTPLFVHWMWRIGPFFEVDSLKAFIRKKKTKCLRRAISFIIDRVLRIIGGVSQPLWFIYTVVWQKFIWVVWW